MSEHQLQVQEFTSRCPVSAVCFAGRHSFVPSPRQRCVNAYNLSWCSRHGGGFQLADVTLQQVFDAQIELTCSEHSRSRSSGQHQTG